MPFVSESQRRKFGALVQSGEMSQSTFDEWSAATGDRPLPERVTKTKKKSPAPPKKGKAKQGLLATKHSTGTLRVPATKQIATVKKVKKT